MTQTILTWTLAIIFSAAGWFGLFHLNWISFNWTRTTGKIIGSVAEYAGTASASDHSARRTVHFPKISFVADGKEYQVKGGSGRKEQYVPGEEISLLYKPSNPNHIVDLNWAQRMMFSAVFIVFGGMCFASAMGWIS